MPEQAALLDVISSPRRREILRLVWDAERSSSEIASHFPASWPSISRSLRELRLAGVVRERRDGQHRFYRADREVLRPLEKFLTEMWSSGLDRIAKQVAKETRKGSARKKRR